MVPSNQATITAKKARPAKASSDRAEKRNQVIAMISRKGGATLAEIAKKMDYELHTVRGMISIFGSRDGQKIVSEKVEGERTYRIK